MNIQIAASQSVVAREKGQLNYVPADRIEAVWPEVESWFLAVEKRSRGRETAENLKDKLGRAQLQLWLWRTDEVKALAVTEVLDLPGCRVCKIIIATGVDRRTWLATGIAAIEEWAALNGCAFVDPVCRKGWERELKALGYRTRHYQMSKDLRHAG